MDNDASVCSQVQMISLFKWLAKPFFRMQQRQYADALIFRRRKEHNAKYQAMIHGWEQNEVTARCRDFVNRLAEVDFANDSERALQLFELALADLDLPSSKSLLKRFDREIEKMIEFPENLPLRALVELYPEAQEMVQTLLAKDKRAVELQLEADAKKVIRELRDHLNDMVDVYQELVDKLPALRKACKPGVIAQSLGFLGNVAPTAGSIASRRASGSISSFAFEVGGGVLQLLLHSLRDHVSTSAFSKAIEDFAALVGWFDQACEEFASSARSRFDPIMRSFMQTEKAYEDEFIDALQSIARSDHPLKPVYEKVYGKLGY